MKADRIASWSAWLAANLAPIVHAAKRPRLLPRDYDPPFDEPDDAIRWLCPIDYNPPFNEPDEDVSVQIWSRDVIYV